MTGPAAGQRRTARRDPARGSLRALRVGVFGGASMLLATAAHSAGGGQLPTWPVLVAIAVLVGTIAVGLTSRRCRLAVLVPTLAAEQLIIHLLLSETTRAACHPAAVGAGHLGHSGSHVAFGCAGAGGVAPAVDQLLGHGPMIMSHLLATTLTAILLIHGERWMWRIVDRVRTATGGQPTRLRVPRPPRTIRYASWLPAAAADHEADPRGPPVRHTAAA